MKTIVVSGKSIEEAVSLGLKQLNVMKEQIRVEVLEHPSKGFFGLIGVKEAKVALTLLNISDPCKKGEDFLQEVLGEILPSFSIEHSSSSEGELFEIKGEDLGLIIGRRGQTLDALQYLLNLVVNRHAKTYTKIILDTQQFRARRRQTLENLAQKLAQQVLRTEKEVVLEPMPPHERRIIHEKLQNYPELNTVSRGEEPHRRIVIHKTMSS